MLLAHHFPSSAEDIESCGSAQASEMLQEVFEQYMTVRKTHVERILDAGNRGGDASRNLHIVAEYAMYAFFWVMCK